VTVRVGGEGNVVVICCLVISEEDSVVGWETDRSSPKRSVL
jgi:hypothetical protein